MNMEIWKDVKGYEGLYQVSSFGRVKSLPKTWVACKNSIRSHNGMILKLTNCIGYNSLALMNNGKRKQCFVHRLVAEAFINNTNINNEVNHINGVRNDNRVENLEWVSHAENIKHADRIGLRTMPKGNIHYNFGKKGADSSRSKIVLDTQTGIYYGSAKEASEAKCINKNTLANMLITNRKNKTSLIYV
jgi:hypothetical protein